VTIAKTRIHLIRHGEVVTAAPPRYNGHADVDLSERGRQQYHALRDRLAAVPLAAIYCSDLRRTVWGAELIAAAHRLTPLVRRELRELNIGQWEGLTWDEIRARWPKEWTERLADIVDYRVPGGESTRDLHERVIPSVRDIVARHPGEEILIVAHGGTNRVILLDAMGAPLSSLFRIEQNYACLNVVDYFSDGNPVVTLLNG
jgi:alpha-ribazole phosphatase